MLEAIIRVLAPHYCLGCGQEDTLLCDACRISELLSVPPRCYKCRKMTKASATCESCRSNGPLKRVWVGCEYMETPKQLIHKLKFSRVKQAYEPIVHQIDETIPFLNDLTIVPISTATTRVRQRGYDQSVLIARGLASLRGLPFQNLLIRRGQTRQVGTNRAARVRQAESFFWVRSGVQLPEQVLLVDDVVTTGATLQAAAKCLRRAGVKRVDAVVFAQKQ